MGEMSAVPAGEAKSFPDTTGTSMARATRLDDQARHPITPPHSLLTSLYHWELFLISLGQGGQNAWSPPSQICSLLPKNVSLGGNWSPRIIYKTSLCEQQVCYTQGRPQEALQVCSPSLPSHPRQSLRSSSYLGAHTHEGAEPEVHLGSVLPAQQGSLCQREYRAAE